jgi:hypothetical protein
MNPRINQMSEPVFTLFSGPCLDEKISKMDSHNTQWMDNTDRTSVEFHMGPTEPAYATEFIFISLEFLNQQAVVF